MRPRALIIAFIVAALAAREPAVTFSPYRRAADGDDVAIGPEADCFSHAGLMLSSEPPRLELLQRSSAEKASAK
jgi:hypothetical protein